MKHGKKLKPNQIWNRYVCPVVEWVGYTIAAIVPIGFVIGAGWLVETLCALV